MKTSMMIALALGLLCNVPAPAQEGTAPRSGAPSAVKVPTQEELEAKFEKLLTKAFLTGRWAPVENGKLGEEKKGDTYEIVKAAKVKDDQWVVQAKMRYGKNEFVMPIPVQVQFAGGTPILIVNNLPMGRDRSYSALVLFFADSYSGSWTGSGGYGGVLYGTIDHDVPPVPKADEEKKTDQK